MISILTARASSNEWRFRTQSESLDDLSAIYDSCHDDGTSVEIRNVHERASLRRHSRELTAQQYETLALTIDRGYDDIPRDVTTEDPAAELGVTYQAISERLRRGHRGLVEGNLPDRDHA